MLTCSHVEDLQKRHSDDVSTAERTLRVLGLAAGLRLPKEVVCCVTLGALTNIFLFSFRERLRRVLRKKAAVVIHLQICIPTTLVWRVTAWRLET